MSLPTDLKHTFFQALEDSAVDTVRALLAQTPALAQQRHRWNSPLVVLFDRRLPDDLDDAEKDVWRHQGLALEQLLLAHGAPFVGEVNAQQRMHAHSDPNVAAQRTWWLLTSTIEECFWRVQDGDAPDVQAQRFQVWLRALPEPHRTKGLTQAVKVWHTTLQALRDNGEYNDALHQLSLRMLSEVLAFQPTPAIFKDVPADSEAARWIQAHTRAQDSLTHTPSHARRRLRS